MGVTRCSRYVSVVLVVITDNDLRELEPLTSYKTKSYFLYGSFHGFLFLLIHIQIGSLVYSLTHQSCIIIVRACASGLGIFACMRAFQSLSGSPIWDRHFVWADVGMHTDN